MLCSGWFEQCQQGKWHRAHAQTGMNPALRTFLFRLSRLARYPVKLVFCYDGEQRPKIKRGHRVSTKDHWMVDPTQRILNVFNMQWLTVRRFSFSLCSPSFFYLPTLGGWRS